MIAILLTFLPLLVGSIAYAQMSAPDGAIDDLTRQVALVIANLTPIVVAMIKRYVPAEALPYLAPLIGGLAGILFNVTTGSVVDPVISTIAGSAGVGVREALDQTRKALHIR